jgi:hypothetical protein
MTNAICRIKPLGRDRYWNRYWYEIFNSRWFDGGMGAYPFELVTLGIDIVLKPGQVLAEGVVHDWASGLLIVEDFGLENGVEDPAKDAERKIAVICDEVEPNWGFYSTSQEVFYSNTVGPLNELA